jgi:hypothetical protein
MLKRFFVCLSIAWSATAAASDMTGLRLFYCIHAERPCEQTTPEVRASPGDALAVARRALVTTDDFVGFVDSNEITLQFYAQGPDSILVDMPMPGMKGSYATHVSQAQALKIIATISPPLTRYRPELNLKFAKWK